MGTGADNKRRGGDHTRGLNFRRIALSEELDVMRPSPEEAAEMRDALLREREAERDLLTASVCGFKTRGIWRQRSNRGAGTDSRFECLCAQTMELSRLVTDIPVEHVTNLLRLPKQNSLLAKAFPKWSFARSRTLWHYSEPSNEEVLCHPNLAGAIRAGVMDFLNDPAADPPAFDKVYKRSSSRVAALFRHIRARISRHLIHFTGWLFLHLLPLFFSRLVIADRQAAMLRDLHRQKLPIVFLPLHRSHLDYVLLPYVLWCLDLPMTFTAAGDNLAVFGLGALLRGFGAFFIRRRQSAYDEDTIYKALLQTYIERLMLRGANLEIYVEAGRSRTGRCRPPKAGLLAMADAACVRGPVKDAILLPMAYGYDRPPDINFGEERMGSPKPPESFWAVLRSLFAFTRASHGGVRVNFGHPVLLSQFRSSLATRAISTDPDSPKKKEEKEEEEKAVVPSVVALAPDLAAHSVHFARRALPLTATHLCAFLLLTRHRDGATAAALGRSFARLARQLRADCPLAFSATTRPADAVQNAASLLAPLIELRRSRDGLVAWLAPLLEAPASALELSYFASHVTEALAMDCAKAAAAVSLAGLAPGGVAASKRLHMQGPLRLDRAKWRQRVALLVRLLGSDFAFRPPCVALDVAIERDSCLWRSFLHDQGSAFGACLVRRPTDVQHHVTASGDQEAQLELDIGAAAVAESLGCLGLALGPLLEAHWAVCRRLYEARADGVCHEEEVARRAMHLMLRRHREGDLLFVESQCLETVHNCLKGLEALDIIERRHCGGGTVAVTLTDCSKLLSVMSLLEAALLRP